MTKKEIIRSHIKSLTDERMLAAASVIKSILALDKQQQKRFEDYLRNRREARENGWEGIGGGGGCIGCDGSIIKALDALDEKMQFLVEDYIRTKKECKEVYDELKSAGEI